EEESLAPIVSQEEDVIPVRRSVRTHKAPDRLCLNVEIDPDRLCFNAKVEEHSLGDLNEPANYKATLSDPKFEKWLVAMNAKMQSMYDNKVWRLVVLPPNAKVVKSKWIYKKKTDMDGKKKKSIWNNLKVLLILIIQGKYVSFKDPFMDLRNHIPSLQEVKTYPGKCFSMKDLGEAALFLESKSIEIDQGG
nr:zinc finger, CCHC-type [Tanacetum cinerariifolium]